MAFGIDLYNMIIGSHNNDWFTHKAEDLIKLIYDIMEPHVYLFSVMEIGSANVKSKSIESLNMTYCMMAFVTV